jgi:hypothetical protein
MGTDDLEKCPVGYRAVVWGRLRNRQFFAMWWKNFSGLAEP